MILRLNCFLGFPHYACEKTFLVVGNRLQVAPMIWFVDRVLCSLCLLCFVIRVPVGHLVFSVCMKLKDFFPGKFELSGFYFFANFCRLSYHVTNFPELFANFIVS